MQSKMVWADKQQVLKQVPCTCIDGRTPGPRFSAAGGSFGLAAWVLAQVEQHIACPLSRDELRQALRLFVREVGPLYLHSDEQALEPIYSRLGLDPDSELEQLNSNQQGMFIHLAKQIDSQGCGHIKLMLQRGSDYHIRPGLLQNALHAFFELFFSAEPNVFFDVLTGEHQESGVVLYQSAEQQEGATQTPLFLGHDEEQFFCHRPLKQALIAQYLDALREAYPDWPSPGPAQVLSQQHDRIAELTIANLAAELPLEVHHI